MARIDVDPARLDATAKALEDQIKVLHGISETRALSNGEKRTLATLEEELSATRELAETARKTEDRAALLSNVTAHGKVIRAFGSESRGIITPGSSETADSDVSAFRAYMRTGETRALTASDSAGGYLIPNALVAPVTETIRKADPILGLAAAFNMQGGNSVMELPHKATHGTVTVTDDFTTDRTSTTNTTPTFSQKLLTAVDYTTDQRAAAHWISSTPGSEDLLMKWIIEDLYEQFGVDIAVGDGSGNAEGLFTASDFYDVVYSGNSAAIDNTDFTAMYAALPSKFRVNGSWLMNSATFALALAMVYPNTDTPLVQWVNGAPTILGRPVYETSSAPDVGAATYPIAFGDIGQAYAIGTHYGPEVLLDKVTATPLVRYVGLARLAGSPWNPDACVLLCADAVEVS